MIRVDQRSSDNRPQPNGLGGRMDEVYIIQEGESPLGFEQETELVQVVFSHLERNFYWSLIGGEGDFGQLFAKKLGYLCMVSQGLDRCGYKHNEHHLHISTNAHLVKQKRRHFGLEKDKLIERRYRSC